MPAESPPPFQVVISQVVQEGLRSLCQQGPTAQVLAAVRVIQEQLASNPLQFGEPAYHLRQLGLEIRFGAVSPLSVRFAVQQKDHIVFVMEFKLLSGTGA